MKTRTPLLFLLSAVSMLATDYETKVLPVFPDGDYAYMTVGDANGDGKNELVAVSSTLHAIRIVRVNSDASIQLLDEIPLPALPFAWAYMSPNVVDMNGDGIKDIVVWARGNNAQGHAVIATRTGTTWVLNQYTTPETDAAYGMAIADVNGDGMPDIVTANHGYSAPANIFVLFNAANSSRFTTSVSRGSGSARIVSVRGGSESGWAHGCCWHDAPIRDSGLVGPDEQRNGSGPSDYTAGASL